MKYNEEGAKMYNELEDNIKSFLFEEEFHKQTVSDFTEFLESLSPQEVNHLSRGRKSQVFNSLFECTKQKSFIPTKKCLNETLYPWCRDKIATMMTCIRFSKNEESMKKCITENGTEYFECIHQKVRSIYRLNFLSL